MYAIEGNGFTVKMRELGVIGSMGEGADRGGSSRRRLVTEVEHARRGMSR
ncbi:hypothetical protein [Nonomuraea sp. LPB2021202275-12-8]